MVYKKNKFINTPFLAATIFFSPLALAANSALEKLNNVGADSGPYQNFATGETSGTYRVSEIVGVVIQTAISLIGVIFLVLMIYAGFNWMTARGDEEKVTRAKDTLIRAIVGIIIVVGSYAIWKFVFDKVF